MTSGVPQGSILGPLLFSIFMSDLNALDLGLPDNSIVVKFADDTVLASSIFNHSFNCSLLCLDLATKWCVTNCLSLNSDKSRELIIPKGSFDSNLLPFTVKRVKEIKYLGVILNNSLNWNSHVNHICSLAARRLYPLRILRPILPKQFLINIYFLLVRSIFDYASPVFCKLNQSNITQMNRIQNRFHRIICCFDSNCTFLPPLCDRRKSLAISLFTTIISNPEHILFNLVPDRLPSGRFSFPFCRTNRRLNSFFPYVLNLYNS